jgi:hypothetical protein
MQFKRPLKIFGTIVGLLTLVTLGVFFLNSKSIKISKEDDIYLQKFLHDWQIHTTPKEVHRSFETELAFISLIQDSVLSNITGEQIPHAWFGNLRYYYEKRQGICYDRAVFLEKLLLLYHFTFRHVYIYFGEQKTPQVTAFFKEHITSHAALEVKTEKGWMAIGTDGNWLGVARNGELMNYFDVRKKLEANNGQPVGRKPITIGSNLWQSTGFHFRIIYGIFSRHGDFFTGASSSNSRSLFTNKKHILPDYNCRMLLYNL